ncbi:tRNA-binding protein [Candidatus Pacearchaeota archaeon CG10_big_fil_rev_8_21_14_0_10_32_14]|nr:MAG: tRNA-binding protein [Candidatus Pacearchaeota archaeon CG10_big_fil_rev_8_21_14_0_10_32_14]
METINWNDFEKVELRVGTITKVEDFAEAEKSAYKIWADFGEYGIKKSSVQIKKLYSKEELVGKQIVGVINFPSKQIANFTSDFLTTGFPGEEGEVILAIPERKVKNGSKLF